MTFTAYFVKGRAENITLQDLCAMDDVNRRVTCEPAFRGLTNVADICLVLVGCAGVPTMFVECGGHVCIIIVPYTDN